MRKLIVLTLTVALSSLSLQSFAQVRRPTGTRRQPTRRPSPGLQPSPSPAAMFSAPTFLARQGAASINEMITEPPAFSYGSSINVWLVKDAGGEIREVGVTGHADSPTCRRVSGQVMSMFIGKERERDDTFVAGAAHMVDRGNKQELIRLAAVPAVRDYLQVKDDLDTLNVLLTVSLRRPSEGEGGQSAVEQYRTEMGTLEERLSQISENKDVAAYLRESKSGDALYAFAREVREFAEDNGLVTVRDIPSKPIEEARARIAAAAVSGQNAVISFEDLLAKAGISEAALFMPLLSVPSGRPVELRIPLARIAAANFEEARRSNRDDVEQAIVGNARQRLVVFNNEKKQYRKEQEYCQKYTPEQLRENIYLTEAVSAEGVPYKLDKPKPMTREVYCKVRIPLNIKIVNRWIDNATELLKTIDADKQLASGSRLEEFNNSTLIDSMLRNWRLPVARSQAAFDAWRGAARGSVWNALIAQLTQNGIAADVIGGEQMVFSIQVVGPDVIVRPLHIIDMARSVVVVDRGSGATRVIDAWSLRSAVPAATGFVAESVPSVPELVRGATKRLEGNDVNVARAQMAEAFSIDPAAAFSEVERIWLSLFPDSHQQLIAMQQSLAPVVEAAEWMDAYNQFDDDPATQESMEKLISAYDSLLDSYPKAPVDLHLDFALILADRIAHYENRAGRGLALSPQVNSWSIMLAFADGGSGTSRSMSPSALSAWRSQMTTALRKSGFTGERLRRQVALSENIKLHGGDSYVFGRTLLALEITSDPAPLIQKAVQTVKQRDPAYWAAAVKAAGRPQERSREWIASEEALKRELTILEESAQLLSRLQDGLRKSYWGAEAADYLWISRTPDLRRLFSVIDAAVGDGSRGSSSAYLGPRSRVDFFIKQQRPMDTLTRAQNASSLQSGSEALLAIARHRISQTDDVEPFRDAIPLRARLWFELGDYLRSLETLLVSQVPLALYHPDIRWQALSGDAVRKPVSVKARREESRIIFSALFEQGGRPADVLEVQGVPVGDADMLITDFNENKDEQWSNIGKVSEQILLSQVAIRPAAERLRGLLLSPELRMALMKSMVYGHSAPGEDFIRSPSVPSLERTIAVTDQVKGDEGRRQRIPTLEEVKRVAAIKIGVGN